MYLSSSENVLILIHVGEKENSDTVAAKIFEKVFFQGGHFRDKCFSESSRIMSADNVSLDDSRNNLKQTSIDDFCNDINRRITINDLFAALPRVHSCKGADPYGPRPHLLKSFRFFKLSYFLNYLGTCSYMGLGSFNKVSVTLLKTAQKKIRKFLLIDPSV